MPPFVSAMAGRFSGVANGFTMAQKTLAIIGVAVLVLGGIALTSWLTRPTSINHRRLLATGQHGSHLLRIPAKRDLQTGHGR